MESSGCPMGNKVSHSVLACISQRSMRAPCHDCHDRGEAEVPTFVGAAQFLGRNNLPLLSRLRTMEKGKTFSGIQFLQKVNSLS